MLPVAVSRYSSDGNAICYVAYFRFLWMKSCFLITGVNGAESNTTLFGRVRRSGSSRRPRRAHRGRSLLSSIAFLLIVFRLSGSDDVVTKTPTQAGITVIIISNLINGGGAGRVDYGGEVYTLVVPVRQILGRAQLIIVHTVHRAPSGDRNSSHAFARLVHICCLE